MASSIVGAAPRGNALVAWWQQLALRERGLVILGVAVLVLVVGYLLLWEPAAQGVRKLEADLPQLRVEAASLRAMADEARRLRMAGGNVTPIAPDDRVAAVRRSLERAGLLRAGAAVAGSAANGTSGAFAPTLTVNGPIASVSVAPSARSDPPEIASEANGRVRVRFSNIDYGVWVAWPAATESELAARAARVSIVALAPNGPVGHVRADTVLDWTAPAQSAQSAQSASSPAASSPSPSRP
ncbi:MAG: type II secretion system protein GspM [Burkholderiaceae bacterium]